MDYNEAIDYINHNGSRKLYRKTTRVCGLLTHKKTRLTRSIWLESRGRMPAFDYSIMQHTARKYIEARYWSTFGEEVVHSTFVAWCEAGGKVHPKRVFLCTLGKYKHYASYRNHDALKIDVATKRSYSSSSSDEPTSNTFLDFSMADLDDLRPVADCLASGMSYRDTATFLDRSVRYVETSVKRLRELLADYNR